MQRLQNSQRAVQRVAAQPKQDSDQPLAENHVANPGDHAACTTRGRCSELHVLVGHGSANSRTLNVEACLFTFAASGPSGDAVAALPQAAAGNTSAAQHDSMPAPLHKSPPVAVPAGSSPGRPSTAPLPASAATMPHAGAKRRWTLLPVGLLVALLCILGLGLLAAYDPLHGLVSVSVAARRANRLAAAGTAALHCTHAALVNAARRSPAYAQQVATEGWHGISVAAAAARRAGATAPAMLQHQWRHCTEVLAADTKAVLTAARRSAASAAAFAEHTAAVSVKAAQHAAEWPAAWSNVGGRCVPFSCNTCNLCQDAVQKLSFFSEHLR